MVLSPIAKLDPLQWFTGVSAWQQNCNFDDGQTASMEMLWWIVFEGSYFHFANVSTLQFGSLIAGHF
jgi:hypothetical protein